MSSCIICVYMITQNNTESTLLSLCQLKDLNYIAHCTTYNLIIVPFDDFKIDVYMSLLVRLE